jgi:dTDP-glucose 4,6-dehydratase
MAKYVVIGSNSFSGQDFVDLLLDDPARSVIGLSRSAEKADFLLRYRTHKHAANFRFRQLDMNRDMVAMLALLDAERPDYIVNFAAQSEVAPSWEHPEHWFATNTVALAQFINHLRRQSYLKRYLHISSPEAYGTCVGNVTETTPDNPSTPYAASKAAADMLISVYQKQYGFPALFVRATNVYGARQQLFKIIPRSMIYVKTGKRIQLHGGGVAVKSYIHIRDVSRAELAVLHDGALGERYHISPDSGVAVRDVVRTICTRMGRRFEDAVEIVAERPGQDAAYVIDSTKARRKFGWKPAIDLDQGIAETAQWVEANWAAITTQPHDYQHKA